MRLFRVSSNVIRPIGSRVRRPIIFQLSDDPSRYYSVSRRQENPLIVGGIGIFVSAVALQYGIKFYNEYVSNSAKTNDEKVEDKNDFENAKKQEGSTSKEEATTKQESFASSWFAKTFYEGGFEDKMTRREAALILGVRESATVERVKEAHRRILVLNHPDKGGSAYLAAKINEAKDLLLKGK